MRNRRRNIEDLVRQADENTPPDWRPDSEPALDPEFPPEAPIATIERVAPPTLSHSESVDAELTFIMPSDASANLKLQELTVRILAGLRDDLALLLGVKP